MQNNLLVYKSKNVEQLFKIFAKIYIKDLSRNCYWNLARPSIPKNVKKTHIASTEMKTVDRQNVNIRESQTKVTVFCKNLNSSWKLHVVGKCRSST